MKFFVIFLSFAVFSLHAMQKEDILLIQSILASRNIPASPLNKTRVIFFNEKSEGKDQGSVATIPQETFEKINPAQCFYIRLYQFEKRETNYKGRYLIERIGALIIGIKDEVHFRKIQNERREKALASVQK